MLFMNCNETTLREIDQSDASDTLKVLNLVKILRQKVADEGESSPYLIPLGERVEVVATAYENRQSETQDILAEFMRIAEEASRAAREQNQMDMDQNTYAVYTVLRNAIEDVNPEQARAVDQVFAQFPDYRWDDHQQSELRGTLYQTLEPSVDIKTKIEITNKLLTLERVK